MTADEFIKAEAASMSRKALETALMICFRELNNACNERDALARELHIERIHRDALLARTYGEVMQ